MSALGHAPESGAGEGAGEDITQQQQHTSPQPHTNGDIDTSQTNGIATSRTVTDEDDVKQENGAEAQQPTSPTLRPHPPPSIKRRESQAAVEPPRLTEQQQLTNNNKKRKRGASPPWQFPSVEATTLKSSDGRRISARHNLNTPIASESESRARSSSLSAPPRSSRASSPPWKKFQAEGPTSMLVDGKRKSGRVNKELAEESPKRVSPRSKKVSQPEQAHAKAKEAPSSAKTERRKEVVPSPKKENNVNGKLSEELDHRAKLAELQAQLEALQPTRTFTAPDVQPKRSHKRKSSGNATISQHDGTTSPRAQRKTPHLAKRRTSVDMLDRPMPKIKLRHSKIPAPHPTAIAPAPAHPPNLNIHQLIDTFELQEWQQPYMENERGPPDLAWFQQRAARQADEEAGMRRRILQAAQPDGVLSKERSTVYQNADAQPEPTKQYSHQDHLVGHALHLRKLQLQEKAHHRQQAKKLAQEAVEYWKMKRGPTEEDIIAEQDRVFKLIYKQVVFDVKAKWHLVAQHVQNKRLQAWEKEQEFKRQARLKEKLARSETMVARQRGNVGDDSVGDVDESDLESSDDDDAVSSGESNMTGSESEGSGSNSEAEEGDGEMDDAALQAYLAHRSDEPPDKLDDERVGVELDGKEDIPMTDLQPTEHQDPEPAAEAESPPEPTPATSIPGPGPKDDLGLADSESQDVPDDAQPVAAEAQDLQSRRSRRSSVAAESGNEADLSEDESTDMDSDDMSSTGDEESGSDDESGAGDGNAGDEAEVRMPSLMGFFSKTKQENILRASLRDSLPTPTNTSAEGDDGDAGVQMDVLADTVVEEDTTGGAEEEPAADPTTNSVQDEPSKPDVEMEGVVSTTALEPEVEQVAGASPEAEAEVEDEQASKHLVPQPALLRGQLRSYQHAGLDWLASLYRAGTNGILADEMGLGKTIQTIAVLAHLAEEYSCWDPHLVIVPTSVVLNWVTEFQKFLPGFRVLAYFGTSEERQAKRKGWTNDPHLDDKSKRGYNVIVTSYNIAMQDINALRNVQWHYLVLDEAHNIRNFNSQRWQVLIRLKTRARLLLTGTPLQNSLTELWSLLTFLTAGDDDPAHGDLEEFLSHWRDPVREIFDAGVQTLSAEAQKVVDQLHISLRPFLLRRLKSEVEKDLPKKTETVVVCKLSKRQRQLYQEYMGLADVKKSLAQGNAVSAGKVLLSLRRVCNHPDLFDPRGVESSWGMERGVAEGFGWKLEVVEKLSGFEEKEVPSILRVVQFEGKRKDVGRRTAQLNAKAKLSKQVQDLEKEYESSNAGGPSTLEGCRALQRLHARQRKLDHLRSAIQVSDKNFAATPVYGSDLRELLTIRTDRAYKVKIRPPPVHGTVARPQPIVQSLRAWPALGNRPLKFESEHVGDWTLAQTTSLQTSVQSCVSIAEKMHDALTRFAFLTPAVTAPVLDFVIPPRVQGALRADASYPSETDYAHESRVRLSIAFPDSRLLVYDSGKLQRLTRLLRELQAKGSRSLIFTQMTGTLNILEQFLSLMGLPYLRLDGSTSPERRHLYASEFNRPDSKYQAMILSSRAGGVGLNLTGASAVIFYDLDWNPQMDRQCMDRAHRIGQVRDVEVFKMVSEMTVEENILRRAEQKSLLDQAVIQEGKFTTDFELPSAGKVIGEESDEDVGAAIDRFLGADNETATAKALESVEDREDVAAAQRAHREEHQDEADFGQGSGGSGQASKAATPGAASIGGLEIEEGGLDGFMIGLWEWIVRDVGFVAPVKAPKGRKRDRERRRRR